MLSKVFAGRAMQPRYLSLFVKNTAAAEKIMAFESPVVFLLSTAAADPSFIYNLQPMLRGSNLGHTSFGIVC